MVNIKPFKGFRPPVGIAEKVASPPYDVVNSQEAREIASDNLYSYLHIVKPEIDLSEDINIYDDKVYMKGAENLRSFIDKQWLKQDSSKCFYAYSQKLGEHEQVGLVAGASVEDYRQDIIKKHEHTRPDKEDDRTRHVDTLNANTGPVFLTYKRQASIDAIIGKVCESDPCYDFVTDDTVHHKFWVIRNPETIDLIQKEFTNVDFLYVADGHHRSASAVRVQKERIIKNPLHTGNEEYNYFLSVIFPDNQMQIMAYNRVVNSLNGLSHAEFLEKVKEKFEMEETQEPLPEKMHCLSMFFDNKWYKLKPFNHLFDGQDVVEHLDVSILQKQILEPILGIKNPRTDKRISFVGGIKGIDALEKKVKGNKEGVAFALFPVTIKDIMSISDVGKTMPPKSTWFEPKLRSGFITKPLI